MREDFTPDNVELWISNWKRKTQISDFVREWLNTFPFERVNVITNHSSVIIDDFSDDIRPLVKIWNNVMRHDDAIGPMTENYNQAYVHTFMSGKRYCICAHDNMHIQHGWDELIRNTEYDLYLAPQGDQIHLITLEGLQTFGWWDERYATNHYHELDYIMRALRLDISLRMLQSQPPRASLVDWHGWHGWPEHLTMRNVTVDSPIIRGNPHYPNQPTLSYNSVGLENYWVRANKAEVPQHGEKIPKFKSLNTWNATKWGVEQNELPHYKNFVDGPILPEINWHPWLDLDDLSYDVCGIG